MPARPRPRRIRAKTPRGFTLIELLVALAVMALLALLSWRGLDGMTRAQALTQQRADNVLALQAGLNQWGADLDALVQLPRASAIDWDGRVLRLTRRSPASPYDGVLVVAWTRRVTADGGQWLRWQSPPLRLRGELEEAWGQAALWALNPGDEARRREVAVTALAQWQLFYYRGNAWTNPLSSDDTSSRVPAAPEGIRVVLTLPPGDALSGVITRDWVQSTASGGKS